jgi:AcrR family transcriptional regulator
VNDEIKLSRRERRRLATRKEILQAARELLLEVGLEELSLREVARRSGFGPASLYTYFENRDAIVVALMAESFERLRQYLDHVPSDLPPEKRILELAVAYMAFGQENPVDLRCILSARPRTLPPESDETLGLDLARLIGQTFQEGVERGVFVLTKEKSVAEMAYGFWALVHGMVVLSGVDLSAVSEDVSAAPRGVLEAYVARLTVQDSSIG